MGIRTIIKGFTNKFISPYFTQQLAVTKQEFIISRVHRQGKKTAIKYKGKTGLKLNFGSGACTKEGFVNIDYGVDADIRLDLRRTIPLPDGCAKLCFSEHFLEHLSYPEGAELFISECYRLLEKGGEFSVSIPDTDFIYRGFPNGGDDFVKEYWEGTPWHPQECVTFIEHVNYHFRQRWRGAIDNDFGAHRFAYDFITLKKVLESCGFRDVQYRKFDPSLDSPHRNFGSLFGKAFK